MNDNITNEILQIVSDEIKLKFCLYFPNHRFKDLKRCLKNAANFKGVNLHLYINLFLSKLLSPEDYINLGNFLTVGETYFFRDKKLFDVLRKNIIPDIISSKRHNKTITIWSSGCSTGEEPYSISILMKELLSDFHLWNINIIATDINLNSLSKAREAVYGEWSFRETDRNFKNRYFDVIEQGKYKLKEEIKDKVTFSYLNLADEIYSVSNKLIQDIDIIFCRNVLMYFSENEAKKIINKYYRILNDKGWLLVAPSEGLFLNNTSFIYTKIGETFLYGKDKTLEQDNSIDISLQCSKIKIIEEKEIHYEPIIKLNKVTSEPEKLVKAVIVDKVNFTTVKNKPGMTDSKVDYESQCIMKANEGNLHEAKLICEQAINQNKVNPKYYYLLASIEQELGNIKNATDALNKALYLNPDFIMAYFDLGNLLLKSGRKEEAVKNFNNVNVLLRRLDEEYVIPDTESVTVGMLKHFVINILNDITIY